jgi:hypothetical protein
LAISFGTIPETVAPFGGIALFEAAVCLVGALVGGMLVWRTRRGAILRSSRSE